jgi:fumarate reductase flavoprotein subunit
VRELIIADDGGVRGAVIASSQGASAQGERAQGEGVPAGSVQGKGAQGERAGAGSEITRVGAKKVVLATNGFAADRELVARYCPEIAGAEYFGARGSTGEAVRWGQALGAALANMGAYQGYAAVAYPQGQILSWTTIEKGGVLVDCNGERFGDEGAGYSGYARAVMAASAPVHAIFDDRIRAIADKEEEFHEMVAMGGVRRADTPEALAALIGVDPTRLAATVAAYNRAAAGGHEDPHRRIAFGIAPLTSPLFATRVVPGLFHTQGGLRVDEQARVLRPDGSVVPNLFAGGGAAGGISGRSGGSGYSSGNGLLTAIGLGRIAGRTAAKEITAARGG